MFFVDKNTGYVGGYHGTIYKTINGGESWIHQSSGTNKNLNSVYFTDSNTGYTVGDEGTVLKTVDGGMPPPELSVTPPDQSVPYTAGTTYFTLQSNMDWIASSDTDWCVVTPYGTGNYTLVANYSANLSHDSRIAKIHIQVPGLDSVSVTVSVTQAIFGLENINEKDIEIIPNPSTGFFRIINNTNNDPSEIIITDLYGNFLSEKQFTGRTQYNFDLSKAAPGVYFVTIKTRDETKIRKLIIER